jgi:hypothetical protein
MELFEFSTFQLLNVIRQDGTSFSFYVLFVYVSAQTLQDLKELVHVLVVVCPSCKMRGSN